MLLRKNKDLAKEVGHLHAALARAKEGQGQHIARGVKKVLGNEVKAALDKSMADKAAYIEQSERLRAKAIALERERSEKDSLITLGQDELTRLQSGISERRKKWAKEKHATKKMADRKQRWSGEMSRFKIDMDAKLDTLSWDKTLLEESKRMEDLDTANKVAVEKLVDESESVQKAAEDAAPSAARALKDTVASARSALDRGRQSVQKKEEEASERGLDSILRLEDSEEKLARGTEEHTRSPVVYKGVQQKAKEFKRESSDKGIELDKLQAELEDCMADWR